MVVVGILVLHYGVLPLEMSKTWTPPSSMLVNDCALHSPSILAIVSTYLRQRKAASGGKLLLGAVDSAIGSRRRPGPNVVARPKIDATRCHATTLVHDTLKSPNFQTARSPNLLYSLV